MTTTTPATSATPDIVPARSATCCRRPMSSIEVTTRGTTLVLHTCSACGHHVWQRDGQVADRAELLAGVQAFLEQPRVSTRRRRRT